MSKFQNVLKDPRNELRGEDIKMYLLDRHGLLTACHQNRNDKSCYFFHTIVDGQSAFILKYMLFNYRMLYSLGYYLKHKSIK